LCNRSLFLQLPPLDDRIRELSSKIGTTPTANKAQSLKELQAAIHEKIELLWAAARPLFLANGEFAEQCEGQSKNSKNAHGHTHTKDRRSGIGSNAGGWPDPATCTKLVIPSPARNLLSPEAPVQRKCTYSEITSRVSAASPPPHPASQASCKMQTAPAAPHPADCDKNSTPARKPLRSPAPDASQTKHHP